MSNKLADRTHCNHGHEFTVENTSFRKDGGRTCKVCNRARSARGKVRRAKMKHDVTEDALAKQDKLDYLKLDAVQAEASDTLNYAIDRARSRPQCESDPDHWQFNVDAPPSTWPTADEAEKMCEGCPFFKECDMFAETLKSKGNSGVWAGKRWVYGKRLN